MRTKIIGSLFIACLLFTGAGCSKGTSQAELDIIAKKKSLAAEAETKAAQEQSPVDGMYCMSLSPDFCKKISFSSLELTEYFKGKEITNTQYKIEKKSDMHFYYIDDYVGVGADMKVIDAHNIQVEGFSSGSNGAIMKAPLVIWTRE